MKNNKSLILKTQRVVQNNQEYLLGVFKIGDILNFTRYTEYAILGFDENDDNKPIMKKGEVQRKISPSKIKSIADFLLINPLAIFPTNIVVAIPGHVIDQQLENDGSPYVEIHINQKVTNEIQKIDKQGTGDIYLSIIDGQHRVKGIQVALQRLDDEIKTNEAMISTVQDPTEYIKRITNAKRKLDQLKEFELSVSFFIDPLIEYQAMIFSTINRTQTKVSGDLVYSLFGLTDKDSPQKTCLNIVNTLNGKEISPLYKRIRLAGSGTKEAQNFYKGGNPVLSQATTVKSLLRFICEDSREEENSRHYSRKYFIENPNGDLPFRKYYGNNQDLKIIRMLFAYFSAVKKVFISSDGNSYWEFDEKNTRKPKNILQTTIGYQALLEILQQMLKEIKEEDRDKIESYSKLLMKANGLDIKDDNSPKKYPFANKTKNVFYNDLGVKIWGLSFEKKTVKE